MKLMLILASVLTLSVIGLIDFQYVDARCIGEPCRAPTPNWVDPVLFYKSADVILIGHITDFKEEVLDLEVIELYTVKVEQYLKNPQDTDMIFTLGQPPQRSAYWYYQPFEVGDRVILYLNSVLSDTNHKIPYIYTIDDRPNPHQIDWSINYMPTPKQQIETLERSSFDSYIFSGLEQIVCKFDLTHVYKKSELHPKCVTPTTAEKLVLRGGWFFEKNSTLDISSNKIEISTDKKQYQQNEKMWIYVTNIGNVPIEITSKYVSLYSIEDDHRIEWGIFTGGVRGYLDPEEVFTMFRPVVDHSRELTSGFYYLKVMYEIKQENNIPLFFNDSYTVEIID